MSGIDHVVLLFFAAFLWRNLQRHSGHHGAGGCEFCLMLESRDRQRWPFLHSQRRGVLWFTYLFDRQFPPRFLANDFMLAKPIRFDSLAQYGHQFPHLMRKAGASHRCPSLHSHRIGAVE